MEGPCYIGYREVQRDIDNIFMRSALGEFNPGTWFKVDLMKPSTSIGSERSFDVIMA